MPTNPSPGTMLSLSFVLRNAACATEDKRQCLSQHTAARCDLPSWTLVSARPHACHGCLSSTGRTGTMCTRSTCVYTRLGEWLFTGLSFGGFVTATPLQYVTACCPAKLRTVYRFAGKLSKVSI